MRLRRAIRAGAWGLVAAGIAAPALRRRLRLPPALVVTIGASGPLALCVVMRRNRFRDVALCALNMWTYLAAYEIPHDHPERQVQRVRYRYPIQVDRALGRGVLPTLRLQRRFSSPGTVNRYERILVWCHWLWFLVPHGCVAYVLVRDPDRFPSAAARMYAVFDCGAAFYWAIPTAPPWWAAAHGHLEGRDPVRVRRMMIEYGEEFWGDLWGPLYDVLGGNPLAAMPSLHFATSLMGAHLLSELGPVAGAIGWIYTSTLGLALVYLGEHYAVDLLAGAALTETIRRGGPRMTPLIQRVSHQLQALELWAAAG